ncbi:response regulator [Bradyrhizobium sp. KBS0727]|jgi:CheY-like chemotaxis protein|uniref:response regulator n=1 Tax=unclassified Bradyrhizobium TaxID=2631580 RepID=UPI00110E2825|nr:MULTISPECIES: response regulator [unclassified Bradyrhizobium]QDW41645.1 response regulator [Bradyrhizobium sp. KBS0725]QDW48252.1 response regulator [Bradyrhizobium sp. KBS0727]
MRHPACSRPVVLIVEDDVLLRWTAIAIIEEAGFDVVEAGAGIEAISVLEKRSDIQTVFTDVELPGSINGIQLAHLIRTRWPSIRLIATSGQLRLREDDLPAGARFLHKPYAVANLTGALKELMEP